MAFWGVEVKPGKPHSHQFHNTQTRRLHISQATLGVGNSTAKSLVQCNVGDKAPVLLCCLIPEKSESCHLALEFQEEDDDVIFSVLGPTSVHLTGFYLDKSSTNVNNADHDDTDSYGEDIGDTENESYDDDDEDEYEDDFIDDDDMHFVPVSPTPKSPVVIEEILDDEKPAKVNGNRKRLKKKKYQVSDSDADAHNDIVKKDTRIFTVDCDGDEDGLPLSTVIKTKYQESDSVNDQMQSIFKGVTGSFNLDNEHGEHIPPSSVLNTKEGNIQEESDKKELIESKNKAEGGSNQVPGSEIEDIDGCEIERGIEEPTNAPLLSLEIGHETDEAPKKKKRKRTKDGQTGGIDVVDVQKKDTVEAISNLSNDMGAGCVGHESEEKRKKKKKRANESRHAGVENDSKFNVQEEENFKVEARIDDTSKTEPVKDQAIDNLSNDNRAVVQSSKENDVKTKKKDMKRAEERQTCEVGDDSMIDVFKEETIQVKEAVSNDFNQEVPVKDNAIDNISNDNGVGCVRHGSEEKKPKKMKKKRVKESRNDGVESDNKVDVQDDQNYTVEARIDDISKNESVKDQADDNLPYDKAFVHSSHENDVKTKKRAKDRQTSEVRDDSIGTYKEEKFQVQEAGSNDINQEVAVKNNAIDNRGDVQDGQENDGKVKKKKNKQAKERQANEAGDQDMINAQIDSIIEVEEARINEISLREPFNIETYEHISNDKGGVISEVGNGIHEKLMKKKKKRAKVEPTGGIDVNMCDVEKQAKSLTVEAKASDIALEEPLKDEGIGNQSNEKCFVQQNDSSLLTLKIGHDNKEKQKKKKKKHAKEEQSGGVGDDSLLVVHKEVQSGNFDAKTDDVTMEERITEEFDKQTNDTIVTIGANYVADEELTEKEKNETPNEGSATNMTPESGSDAIANDAKK